MPIRASFALCVVEVGAESPQSRYTIVFSRNARTPWGRPAALIQILLMNSHFLNKRIIHLLGFAGLIPFVLLTLACWLISTDWLHEFIRGQLAYGIAVLSFLGGIHWGAVVLRADLSVDRAKRALAWGVLPTIIAWFSTMAGGFGFALLMAGFIAAYQVDKRLFIWYGLPTWFIQLRFKLTCVAVAALMLTVIAGNVRG